MGGARRAQQASVAQTNSGPNHRRPPPEDRARRRKRLLHRSLVHRLAAAVAAPVQRAGAGQDAVQPRLAAVHVQVERHVRLSAVHRRAPAALLSQRVASMHSRLAHAQRSALATVGGHEWKRTMSQPTGAPPHPTGGARVCVDVLGNGPVHLPTIVEWVELCLEQTLHVLGVQLRTGRLPIERPSTRDACSRAHRFGLPSTSSLSSGCQTLKGEMQLDDPSVANQ